MKLQIIIWMITTIILINTKKLFSSPIDSLLYKAIYLEKAIMNSTNKKCTSDLIIQKSKIYKSSKDFSNAVNTLKRINFYEVDSSFQQMYLQEKIINLFFLQLYGESLYEIRALDFRYHEYNKNIELIRLSLLLENSLWNEFREAYAKACTVGELELPNAFNNDMQNPVYKDPAIYKKRSAVFPGLGLISSGHKGIGYLNLSLQVAFAVFTIYNLNYGFYATAVFSGIYPLKRFYNGGKTLTQSVIEKDNELLNSNLKKKGYYYIGLLQ